MYYQIAGFGAHTHGWFGFDSQRLCEVIFLALSESDTGKHDEKGVEIILGMLRMGASYLLITQIQMDRVLRCAGAQINSRRLGLPRPASCYASLSPIIFYSPAELHNKVKTYTQKPKTGNPLGKDTSQANKMFDQDNPARACFEHQRVLWKAIQGTIDFDKFTLQKMFWLASTSLVALTFQAWNADSIEQRRTNPKVLDLGLTSFSCLAFREENYVGQVSHSIHIKLEENAYMSNKGITATPFNHGTTEIVKKDALGERLNSFFSSIASERAFFLVYDAELTCNALKTLGVDVSDYRTSIESLLTQKSSSQHAQQQKVNVSRERRWGNNYQSRGDVSRDSHTNARRRSRSPPRRPEPYPQRPRSSQYGMASGRLFQAEEDNDDVEDEDDQPQKTEVYVIDVRALFLALSRLNPADVKSLPDLAARLGIPVDQTVTCAGNECHLLVEAWKRMASGKAIDEQRVERWSSNTASTLSLPRKDSSEREASRVETAHADPDEEADPNDIVVTRLEQPQARAGGHQLPTDDYDTDDSDYWNSR